MSTLAEELGREFPPEAVLHFIGRGGQPFDYIEDESVMDRLDAVLGVGRWSVTVEPISLAEGIVKVRLSGFTPQDEAFTYEDFGYQTREGGEQLKEAVSDGIRRCGRYLGIGRYLYRKHDSIAPRPVSSSTGPRSVAPAAAPTPIRPAAGSPPEDPYPDELFHGVAEAPRGAAPGDTCAEHGAIWKGEPGDLYHRLDGGGYHRHESNVQKPRAAGRR